MSRTVKIVTNHGKGTIETFIPGEDCRAKCRRYVGKFSTLALQDKAELGLWETFIEGNPFVPSGSGSTPVYAIDDSISRSRELIKHLENGIKSLEAAKQKATEHVTTEIDPACQAK